MKSTLLTGLLAVMATGTQAQSATYVIDPTHTFATYEISHFNTSTNRGRFDKKEGTVTFDQAAKTGRVEITLDLTGVNTGVEPLNKHLQSKDFFNVAETPTAKFIGDKFAFNGDKVSEVSGTLTLRGKTHPVTLKATNFNCYMSPMLKREVCGGDFVTTLKRSLWGVDYGLTFGFSDEVKLLVQVEAIKQ
ncbi:MAG: YceI family protein [Rubrivivax sp.]